MKSRKDTQTIQLKLESFKEEASKLFDIAACKCEFQTCKREKSKKVPQREQAFLADQRGKRVMAIGTVDIKVPDESLCLLVTYITKVYMPPFGLE